MVLVVTVIELFIVLVPTTLYTLTAVANGHHLDIKFFFLFS